jgi:membrane associated rhomboid family serine protease
VRMTYLLIALCTLVFVLQLALGDPLTNQLVFQPISLLSAPWSIITSMFAHADFEHILFNMIALFMLGTVLEERVGSNKFLFIFLLSGLVGAMGFMLFNSPFEAALGASGAIYGIIGALVLLTPNLTVYFYLIPVPMYVAGPIYALIEIIFLGKSDNIAHSAHVLGFFGGLALAFFERGPSWPPRPPMGLLKALGIPIALCLVAAVAAGVYYTSDQLNQKIIGCVNMASDQAAKACFLQLSKDYKSSPDKQSYVCVEYERIFSDNACVGV